MDEYTIQIMLGAGMWATIDKVAYPTGTTVGQVAAEVCRNYPKNSCRVQDANKNSVCWTAPQKKWSAAGPV